MSIYFIAAKKELCTIGSLYPCLPNKKLKRKSYVFLSAVLIFFLLFLFAHDFPVISLLRPSTRNTPVRPPCY